MRTDRGTDRKRQPGTWLMRGGLLLIAAALLLAGYNLWDDRRAGLAASQALEQLLEREAGEREAGPGQEGGLGTGV